MPGVVLEKKDEGAAFNISGYGQKLAFDHMWEVR